MSAHDTEQSHRVDPPYLANYGLKQAPFSSQHDDRFLYLDAERAQRLNLLQHMTQTTNLLLIVQGEQGVGKTSLLTRFITTRAENWHICQVTANTFMDAGQLMYQIAQGFGVHQVPQDSDQLQEMLYTQIATCHHNGQVPILLIDDAHELPKDALMAIFHLADTQVDNASLLRIILFAEPQIEKILNSRDVRPLRERITHTMSIPLLDEETTAEYMKHRMAAAGFNGGSPFTPKMVKRIYRASGGNPARINQFAHEMLDKGDFEHEEVESIVKPAQPTQTNRFNATRVAVIAGAILVIGLLLFHNELGRLLEGKPGTTTLPLPVAKQNDKTKGTETSTSVAGQLAGADEKPVVTDTAPASPSEQAETNVASSGQPDKLKEKIIPLHPSSSGSPPAPSAQLSQQNPSTATTTSTQKPAQTSTQTTSSSQVQASPASQSAVRANASPSPSLAAIEPDPVPGSNKPQNILVHGQGFTGKTRVYVRWSDKDHEIPSARVKQISVNQLQVRLTVGRDHDEWQMHVVNPGDKVSNTLSFRVAISGARHDQQTGWIKSQPSNHFTLQLFSSYEQKSATGFIQQHRLGKQARVFASRHKGKMLYSVVDGSYPDKAAAQDAIKTLPATLHGIKPWIRRFADVQASMVSAIAVASSRGSVAPSIPAPDSKVFSSSLPRSGNIEQNESWIWSQDPSYFTLQLLGGRELSSVKRLLKRYPELASHAVYFRSQRNGEPWYTIIYGVYANREKAAAAVKRLPATLQKSRPWIRSFASVHTELSRAH